ncbi:probable 2-oxoglutarate-dependent dioxygenase AOP1 [Cynara cardunculus var. scolymus]|uniref:Non-heme dioxygenase N-terminal domain-containing protein n=1 Tax=Cynara cardunculus var. scolymus TaxID=59895 RepID=A0A103Y7Q1_CYNCS|nr:probable 2-oxoglutarate-dependent dioxygenase AOP1 [Cynara cardunculus var. scolymus]KVI04062.1 Non-heme dioxygenase N-terminal domain-containing protein [Cynara cardunculus var. scolymus]
MVSLSQPKLPVIHMADLNPGTESWISTSQKVTQALEKYGCFVAVYERVSQQLKKEVLDSLRTPFDLPTDTKINNTSDKPFHGYMRPVPTRPLYQSLGIEHATSLDDVQRFTNLMWPSGNHHFSNTMHSYATLVTELENAVRQMVFQSYGVEKYYESFNESMNYLFKVMKYSAPKPDQTNLGVAVHTDKSFITVLGQINEVNGLEVEIEDGKWITFEFLPLSFVVLATDPLMAWSNGRVKSPRHRVIMNGQEDRYSIVLFSYKKGIIQTPEEIVDQEHPLRFKPFDHYKFLDFVSKDENYLDEKAIKLFCGV